MFDSVDLIEKSRIQSFTIFRNLFILENQT